MASATLYKFSAEQKAIIKSLDKNAPKDRKYQQIKHTELPGDILVSTVWLGLNHNFSNIGDALPLIFESMVFVGQKPKGGYDYDTLQRRYHTEVDALVGHEEIVSQIEKEREE